MLIISLLTPFIGILTSFFVLSRFFELNISFGPWTRKNYIIFLYIGYNILLLRKISHEIPSQFQREKFWETVSSIIIAPINQMNWFFGIFLSHIVIILLPFTLCIILCYLLYPVSIITILFIIGIFFLISLIFAGIGIMIGIFAISKENAWKTLDFMLILLFWLSCITYPFKIFPSSLQIIINLNPFYHMINLLRLTWIENDIIKTISNHYLGTLNLIICSFLFPSLGIYVFRRIYKKYGIVE